eukprot:Gb_02901 [translate_table: standard]
MMATQSFWMPEVVEDSLDTYSQEWEQFIVEDAIGQPCQDYLDLMHSGVIDYARAPIMYLPYPIVVEMFRRFENDSFWFQDKVIQVNEELINHITGLPLFGDKIDLREEARSTGREVILQKLFLRCKEDDVWNKSNGFTINRITNEGAKWATRILTRRVVGIEANTYLSHQWAAEATKLAEGTVYSWASWIEDKFKEHCLASETSGRNFPMPSLLAIVCMEALGPPGWIQLDELPRLNSYSRLQKKGVIREKATYAYLALRWLNEGPEAINKGHFSKEPYSMVWSPSNLPRIPLLEVQEKEGAMGKLKKKSLTKGFKSPKGKHSKLSFEYRTSEKDRNLETIRGKSTQIPLIQWGHISSETNPSVESTFDIVPPPSLIAQELTTRIEELELKLVLQVHRAREEKNSLSQIVNTLMKEIKIVEHIVEIQQLKTVLAHLITNIEEAWQSQLAKLISMCGQLASKRVALEKGYCELLGIMDSEQRTSREATMLQHREKVPESIGETKEQRASGEPETPLPSMASENVLDPLTEQHERRSPGSPSREFKVEKTLMGSCSPYPSDRDKSPTALGPLRDLDELLDSISLAPLSVPPLGFLVPHAP